MEALGSRLWDLVQHKLSAAQSPAQDSHEYAWRTGRDPALLQETLRAAEEDRQRERPELEKEARMLRLKRASIDDLVSARHRASGSMLRAAVRNCSSESLSSCGR